MPVAEAAPAAPSKLHEIRPADRDGHRCPADRPRVRRTFAPRRDRRRSDQRFVAAIQFWRCDANNLLRPRQRSAARADRHVDGLGPSPARPWRRDLHRPARPRGPGADRLRPGPRRDVRARRSRAQRVLPEDRRQGAQPPRRHRERRPDERQDRGALHRARGAEPERLAAVPDRRGEPVRDDPADPPRARPAPADDAAQPEAALPRRDGDPQVPRCQRLHRHRDADADQEHAGGRARLPGAEPRPRGHVLRAAAEPAALQAAADGGRLRPLLPDHQVLPRRGPARRPPARVHADRHRDLVPAGRRDPHDVRRHAAQHLPPCDRRRAAAVPGDEVRRRDAPVRLRQAGPAGQARADRADRRDGERRLQGLRGAGARARTAASSRCGCRAAAR